MVLKIRFHKLQELASLIEELLASQERLPTHTELNLSNYVVCQSLATFWLILLQ